MRKSDKRKNIEEANKRLLGEDNINELGTRVVPTNQYKRVLDTPSDIYLKLQLNAPAPYIELHLEDWSYALSEEAVQTFKNMDEEKQTLVLKQAGQTIVDNLASVMASCMDGICKNN